jgi:virulence factor
MIRLGILDFDSSHAVEFAKRLNHQGIDQDQWVEGASVVVGCPGSSEIMPERIPGYRKEIERMQIAIVEQPEAMLGKVDGMLIESQQGGVHWQRAKPFLEAGIPCFVDKPFACSYADARNMAKLAAARNLPIFSASSLRYAPELVHFVADARHGKIHGALAYGPGPLHDLNPGLFHYGIHAVEILYTLMGPGCERVSCTHEKDADVVVGHWRDGRVGTVRGMRAGKYEYGCMVFTETGVRPLALAARYIYRELLKQIVEMFTSRKAPLDIGVTLEIVSFIEAANRSGVNHGLSEKVANLLPSGG